jgi:glycosyltransferase involved in cell wall biosynthesis
MTAVLEEPVQTTPAATRPTNVNTSLRLAYLLNQHPYTSCTFIRREIHALEEVGFSIQRMSIRPTEHKLVEPADLAEREKTRIILSDKITGLKRLLGGGLKTLLTRPRNFLEALRLAVRLGRRSDRGIIPHLAYLLEACVARQWCADWKIDHVHCHFATNPAAVAMLCRVLGGPTYSFTVHGPQEFDQAPTLSYAEKIGRAKFVSTITHFAVSQLYRWSRFEDWSKIQIVRCGVNDTFLTTPPMPVPQAPRLLNIGRLSEQKGQVLLVEAAALLKARGVDFLLDLVGDGELRGEIEQRIARHGLQQHVRLLGWQNETQVRDHIQNSRAVVLASFAEGLPVVLMEALALGRPAISTAIAGVPELIETGVSGWLVPAGSVEALAEAMKQCVEASTESLDRMGQTGRERVRRQHDVRTEARRLAELFSSGSSVA